MLSGILNFELLFLYFGTFLWSLKNYPDTRLIRASGNSQVTTTDEDPFKHCCCCCCCSCISGARHWRGARQRAQRSQHCVRAGQTATAVEEKCFEARSQQQLCCCFRLRKCRAAKEREERSAVRAKPLRTTRRATTRLPDLSLLLYRSFARAWSHSLAAAVVAVAAKCSDLVYSCTAFIQALSSRSWPGRGSGGDHVVVDEFWQCRRGSSAAAAAADSNRMQWW